MKRKLKQGIHMTVFPPLIWKQ